MLKTALQNLENQLFHECQLVLWPILLDQTTNSHFLGTLRWVIVLTGSMSAPLRPWKTLYPVYHNKVLKVLQNLVKQFARECQSIYKPFVLDQTVITVLSAPNTVAHSAAVLTDFTWTPFHSWKLIYQDPEGSSTPGKPFLPLGQVNVLAIYTESNHEYWLSDPTAVVHSTDWLDLNIFHLRKMLCQGPEDSSTPGKPVSPWRKVNVLAIYSESNHEYRRSDPTAVVNSDDWLDLNTFLHAKDALSRTRRFMNTWKTDFAMKASECSGDLYSATGRPIHFMLCSRVGFSGTADLMALFSIRTNSRWRPPPSWVISNGHISATAHDLLI